MEKDKIILFMILLQQNESPAYFAGLSFSNRLFEQKKLAGFV
jgi:hypothetical protein